MRCKECNAISKKEDYLKIKNDPDKSLYIDYLNKNSNANAKLYVKRNFIFDTTPIEQCYEQFLNVLRKNANSRASGKTSYDLDLEFLIDLYHKQNKKCAITGILFRLDRCGTKRAFAPSIDRIECSKGYTKDNVRLVCLVVNIALNDFGDNIFDEMCSEYIKNKLRNQ